MVDESDQRAGTSGAGAAASTSSTGDGVEEAQLLEEVLLPLGADHRCAMRAAPMFEDFTITSSTVSRGP